MESTPASTTAERLRRLSAGSEAAAEAAAAAREARNAAIAEADGLGWTLARIAEAARLSVGHTQRILVRVAADRSEGAGHRADPLTS